MAVIEVIRKKINKSKEGTLFFNNSFPEFDDEYVRQILSDLCEQGLVVRIAFGIYLKPMVSRCDGMGGVMRTGDGRHGMTTNMTGR